MVTSIVESKYKERFFCKTINHLEDLSRGEVADSLLAVRYVTELQHPNMHRPKEIYGNPNKLCLLSPLLEDSHESLLSYCSSGEENAILNQSQIIDALKVLLLICTVLHNESLSINNLQPSNIFVSNYAEYEIVETSEEAPTGFLGK